VIFGEHCCIRAAEPDDAPALKRVYQRAKPRAAALDRRREPIIPTTDELRELLSSKDVKLLGEYYAVEDATGEIRGFCCLRAGRQDVFYGEMLLLFIEDADLDTGMAGETFAFLKNKAFVERRLNKIVTQCLDTETALRSFLLRQGFTSDGIAREVLYTLGRWFNNETLSLRASQHEDG
jgi:RimJ/RimL family protein N-acetyltransferase